MPWMGDARNVSRTLHDRVLMSGAHHDDIDLTTLLLHLDPSRHRMGKLYTFRDRIGSGSYGTVRSAEYVPHPGELRAVKTIPKGRVARDLKFVVTEVEAMVRVRYFEDSKAIYLVTELCTCGDFSALHAHNCPSDELRSLFCDVTRGVSYCHSLHIAHRDLKFENCMITREDGCPRRIGKVIDFGLATIMERGIAEGEWATEVLGTKYFVAPEVLKSRPLYGVKCDVWSLGVMLYIVFTDEHPMAKKAARLDSKTLFRAIRNGNVRSEPLREARVPEDAEEVIRAMLVAEPERRPDASAYISGWIQSFAASVRLSRTRKAKRFRDG